MQITANRQWQGGWKKEGNQQKSGGGKEEALKVDPNKTLGGDLRGRRADFNGSEREVTNLEKGG